MENENGTTPSIRDTLATAVETIETAKTEPAKETFQEVPAEAKTETKAEKEQRARDEAGRFAPEKKETKAEIQPEKPRPQRPSSWKKDYWGHWDKLSAGQALTPEEAMQIAEYAAQREQEFAKGVSTYKTEWDRAKPVLEAINPIMPLLQQNGLDANRFINDATHIYRALTTGNPQQKIGTLFQIAQMYQVPLEEVFDQTEDGRWVLNPSKVQIPTNRQPAQQPDFRNVVKEVLLEENATRQVSDFVTQKEKYPYVEQVKETMAGLLRAGLVEDLQTAYDAALNMPQHASLKESIQQAKQAEDEARRREEAAKLAANSRAKVVSPRSSTPATATKVETGKGIRSVIEDAINSRSGRV